MPCYLIHFDTPVGPPGGHQATHYLGYADDVDKRLKAHKSGRGARLMEVCKQQGIGWQLARTWPDGDRDLERKLKKRKKHRALCPICLDGRRHPAPDLEDDTPALADLSEEEFNALCAAAEAEGWEPEAPVDEDDDPFAWATASYGLLDCGRLQDQEGERGC